MSETTVMHKLARVVEILVQILQNTLFWYRIPPPPSQMKIVGDYGTSGLSWQNTPPPPHPENEKLSGLQTWRVPEYLSPPWKWKLSRFGQLGEIGTESPIPPPPRKWKVVELDGDFRSKESQNTPPPPPQMKMKTSNENSGDLGKCQKKIGED